MQEYIGIDTSGITLGKRSIQKISEAIAKEALEVASSKLVQQSNYVMTGA